MAQRWIFWRPPIQARRIRETSLGAGPDPCVRGEERMIRNCGFGKCEATQEILHVYRDSSLPLMVQIIFLKLLICCLCQHMANINNHIVAIPIILTVLGVLFYFGTVIADILYDHMRHFLPSSILSSLIHDRKGSRRGGTWALMGDIRQPLSDRVAWAGLPESE